MSVVIVERKNTVVVKDGKVSVVSVGIQGPEGIQGPVGPMPSLPGSDKQVLFNDGGVFGADAGLVFDKATDVLTVAGSVRASAFGSVADPNLLHVNGLRGISLLGAGDNYFFGPAGLTALTGSGNVAVGGTTTLSSITSGVDNTAVGSRALRDHQSGIGNTAVGVLSQSKNIAAGANTSVGDTSLENMTGGLGDNTAVGYASGRGLLTGAYNSFFGAGTALASTAASENAVFGHAALTANLTGNKNSAFGFQSLYNTTSDEGAAVGYRSLWSAIGTGNTAIGAYSGFSLTDGIRNTILGYSAGNDPSQLVSAIYSIAIGAFAYNTASYQVVLGASTITETILRGAVKAGTSLIVAGTADSATHGLFAGLTKGVRIGSNATAGLVEGVDSTGFTSFQPLHLHGSTVSLQSAGATVATVDSATGIIFPTDNTYDIGAGGATRPRDVHIGRDLKTAGRTHVSVVATASLPAAGAVEDGRVLIEDNGAGDRNLVVYAGGQRFRIDGGAAF